MRDILCLVISSVDLTYTNVLELFVRMSAEFTKADVFFNGDNKVSVELSSPPKLKKMR